MKNDLKDITFLLPVRIDSINRLENVFQVVNFLQKHFHTHIIILEAAYYNNRLLKKILPKNIEYYFIEDKDPVFHRTKYLNIMTRKVKTDFLAIWDVDVFTPLCQISDSMKALRSRDFDISFPYNKSFMDVTEYLKIAYINSNGNIDILPQNVDKMNVIYGEGMKGGAILVNTRKYIEAGMDNEHFYGWGPEDLERVIRWEIMGYRIHRSEGYLYHFPHPRDINGWCRSGIQEQRTASELDIIRNRTKEELKQQIKKWEW